MKRLLAWILMLALLALPALGEEELETITLTVRESVQLSPELLPGIAPKVTPHKNVRWQSSDPSIAVVDRGYMLRAKREGECVFTAMAGEEALASFRLVVEPGLPMEGNAVSVTAFTRLNLADSTPEIAALLREYPNIMWESADPAIAIVNHSNHLYGKKAGTCQIYGLSDDMQVAQLDVTVAENPNVTEKFIAFTFDDGPSKPTWTILDTLDEYGIHATFFMVGEMVEIRSSTALAVYQAGHELGNHSYSHKNLDNLSAERALREISRTDELVYQATGAYPTVLRAPGGDITAQHAVEYSGDRYFVHWNLGTGDWKSRDTDAVCAVVRQKVRDRAVVLMHDLYPTTARAVQELVPELILQGYTFVTISQMMEITGLPEGKIYCK